MWSRVASLGLVLLALSGAAAAAPVTWPLSDGGNGHAYEYVPGTRPWTQARVEAADRTFDGIVGHLATVTSQAETDFLTAQFAPAQAWLGGYQDRTAPDYAEPAAGWRWVTGEPWGYTNWATQFGLPDNFGGEQDYVKFATGPLWDDLQDNPGPGDTGVNGYLVEYDTVPEPTAAAVLGGLILLARPARRRC